MDQTEHTDHPEVTPGTRRRIMIRTAAGLAQVLFGDDWTEAFLMIYDAEGVIKKTPSTSYRITKDVAPIRCIGAVPQLAGAVLVVHSDAKKIAMAIFSQGHLGHTTVAIR